jgi:lupus La protein
MWTLHSKTPEHWVPINTIASFKRMRDFQSEGIDWLVDALKDSTVLEIDESKTNVRRTTEVQESKNQFERSIYAVCIVAPAFYSAADPIPIHPERIW